MKRLIIILLAACLMAAGCTADYETPVRAAAAAAKSQRLLGEFKGDISVTKGVGDKIMLQKQLENSFELHSLDIKTGLLKYEYRIDTQNKQMYFKQLGAEKSLLVKQLDNSEENNQLIFKNKEELIIAKRIAYSTEALVELSPKERFVIYCSADELQNSYQLHLYDLELKLDKQLSAPVGEALLNDMEGNVLWSPTEDFVLISNKFIFNTETGSLAGEINAAAAVWSPSGQQICYIKQQSGFAKALCNYEMSIRKSSELFIANSDEHLSGAILWNKGETKLAFFTVSENNYKALYSLDIENKVATRLDNMLQLDGEELNQLVGLHYNETGNVIACAVSRGSSTDLYMYSLETSAFKTFINVEYLHEEDNESYVCTADNELYTIQGKNIIGMDEDLNSRIVHQEDQSIDELFISEDGKTMLIMMQLEDGICIRQIENFAKNG